MSRYRTGEEDFQEAWELIRDACIARIEHNDAESAAFRIFELGYRNGTQDMSNAMSEWRTSIGRSS